MRFQHECSLDRPAMAVLPEGTHYWCRCGQTRTPPYCDGSHQGSEITPLAFESDGVTKVAICTCGMTGAAPYCDGSHMNEYDT